MPFSVTVDWAPAHELVVSFWAFTESRLFKYLEVDPKWHSTAVRQIGSKNADMIAAIGRDKSARLCMRSLLRKCPEPRTPPRFLDWLASLSPADLAGHRMSARRKSSALDERLSTRRDDLIAALDVWNTGYFAGMSEEITRSLSLESESRREAIAHMDAQVVVEDATNGISLGADIGIREVVLTPQYHCRPYNIHCQLGDVMFYAYPVDVQDGDDCAPPAQLERLARAFSDASRLRILRFLSTEPRTFMDIVAFSDLARSTVHHHMVALRAAGVVRILETPKGSLYTPRPGYHEAMSRILRQYVEEPAINRDTDGQARGLQDEEGVD
jgi:DNA-binding transcriptional ArsR family regulator